MMASNSAASFFFRSPSKFKVPETKTAELGISSCAVVFGKSNADIIVTFMLTGSFNVGALVITKPIFRGVDELELLIEVPMDTNACVFVVVRGSSDRETGVAAPG
jgi:hypothetical protein